MTSTQKIWISGNLLRDMKKDIVKHYPNETGGVLMGYTGSNGDVVVTDLVMSGENAVHKPFRFEPNQEYHEQEIARIFRSSMGKITYLGDWHSHPNSSPDMSRLDRKTLFKISNTTAALCPTPVMMILGYDETIWNICVYRLVKRTPLFFKPYRFKYEVLILVSD